jgi:nucleoside-diphosphate-sugar epimerase
MADTHVVFGCSGPVGVALMERLAAAGHDVLGVCRSGRSGAPPGARIEAGDVADRKTAERLAAGATVVYGCVGIPYPTWLEAWPEVVDGLLTAAETAGARLVFADNLYCYGPHEGALTEDLPLTDHGRKPALRAEMARTMLEAHHSGRAQVALVRASDFFGPRVLNSGLGERVFRRLLVGKPAQVLGDPDQPHTFTYVPDFARALETIAAAGDDTFGQAWHVPSPPTLTQRQIVQRLGELAGRPGRIQTMPRIVLAALALAVPIMRELRELMYQWERPFEVDDTKFRARFKIEATPLDEALAATLEWYGARATG